MQCSSILTTLSRYAMVAVVPVLYIFWKIVARTRIHRSHEVDLKTNQAEINDYTQNFVPTPPKYVECVLALWGFPY